MEAVYHTTTLQHYPLLRADLHVVKLLQLRQIVDDCLPVAEGENGQGNCSMFSSVSRLHPTHHPPPVPLGAGVFCQPEVFQLAEILEVGELPQGGDVVLAEEELLQ